MVNHMHPELGRIILEMSEAINEAIDDANRHKTRYTAVQGQQHTPGGGSSYYTFVLENDWEPGPNTSVLILRGQVREERSGLQFYNVSFTMAR